MIRARDLTIDRERYLVTVAGRPVHLTYMEFNVLWAIAQASGRVVTYESLAEELWGKGVPDARRRLAVLVSRVRSKLGAAASVVDTVTRVGYRFAPE